MPSNRPMSANRPLPSSSSSTGRTTPPTPAPPDTRAAHQAALQSALAILATCADQADTKEARAAYQAIELEFNSAQQALNDANLFRDSLVRETAAHRNTRNVLNQRNSDITTLQYRLATTPIAIPTNHQPFTPLSPQELYQYWANANRQIEDYEIDGWESLGLDVCPLWQSMADQITAYITTALGASHVTLPTNPSNPTTSLGIRSPIDGAWSIARPRDIDGNDIGCSSGTNQSSNCGNWYHVRIPGAPTNHHYFDRPLCAACLRDALTHPEPSVDAGNIYGDEREPSYRRDPSDE